MKSYFQLHIKMMSRKLWESGFKPLFGYILLAFGFLGLSWMLFRQTNYAPIILSIYSVSIVAKLSSNKRNDLLKLCFGDEIFLKLRILENVLLTIPFLVVLILFQEFIFAGIVLILNILQAINKQSTDFQFTIPTPFGKKPFEFPAGFRTSIIPYLTIICLTFYSIYIQNFNLGIFSILLIFVIAIRYHTNTEDEYFVWIFAFSPLRFLSYKIVTSWLFATLLIAPITIAMLIFYPQDVQYVFIFLGFGYIYLATFILAKYASFPQDLNFENTLLTGASIFFPPILLVLVPFFFITAHSRLKPLLP